MRCRITGAVLTAITAVLAMAPAWSQLSTGRGARDPLPAQVIVGSEGKGLFTSAGVPPGNTPIFAARDGAVPAGVKPLPRDILSGTGFLHGRALWVRSGP